MRDDVDLGRGLLKGDARLQASLKIEVAFPRVSGLPRSSGRAARDPPQAS